MTAVTSMVEKKFTLWRGMRLSSFQIGSAMGDILVTSIWNRILISNFGIPAAPVSFLIALRYLLSPLSLWAGFITDHRLFFGLRRTPVIWLGRGLMIISLPLLGLSVNRLSLSTTDTWGWSFALASSLLYGVGTLISGSPYLALVRDSAPEKQQGLAMSVAETVLIVCFAIVGITFSFWMETYDPRVFWEMIIATMVIGGFFWFFAIVGVEKRPLPNHDNSGAADDSGIVQSKSTSAEFSTILRRIWSDQRTRRFFVFLSVATFAAWMQDAILEPFGADVFHMAFDRTTRFNSYWQTATVITLIASTIYLRKKPPEVLRPISVIGVVTMAAGMLVLAAAALLGQPHLIEIGLLVFGGGFGVFTFGAFSLMAVMSPNPNAGTYLGLWTIAILVFKGLGTFGGGALRDLFYLSAGLPAGVSYGLIFAVEGLALVAAAIILRTVDIRGFAQDTGRGAAPVGVPVISAD